MNPRDRINKIIEITNVMNQKEWPAIDLVLSQYGFRTEEQWNGNKEYYIQTMIQDETNDKLLELASYYNLNQGIDFEIEDKYISWSPSKVCVFLSHLASDKVRTAKIQKELEEYNISSFVAHNDIEPGLSWQEEIEKALMSCDALVALLVPNFHKSNWTDQEIGCVMGRGKKIVNVRLGMDPYGFIGRFQGIQGLGKSEREIARDIFKVLAISPKTSKKMSEAIINKFVHVGSWAEAKENIEMIESLTYLDDSMIEVIKRESLGNSQIRDAFGVPERVEKLIQKV